MILLYLGVVLICLSPFFLLMSFCIKNPLLIPVSILAAGCGAALLLNYYTIAALVSVFLFLFLPAAVSVGYQDGLSEYADGQPVPRIVWLSRAFWEYFVVLAPGSLYLSTHPISVVTIKSAFISPGFLSTELFRVIFEEFEGSFVVTSAVYKKLAARVGYPVSVNIRRGLTGRLLLMWADAPEAYENPGTASL